MTSDYGDETCWDQSEEWMFQIPYREKNKLKQELSFEEMRWENCARDSPTASRPTAIIATSTQKNPKRIGRGMCWLKKSMTWLHQNMVKLMTAPGTKLLLTNWEMRKQLDLFSEPGINVPISGWSDSPETDKIFNQVRQPEESVELGRVPVRTNPREMLRGVWKEKMERSKNFRSAKVINAELRQQIFICLYFNIDITNGPAY